MPIINPQQDPYAGISQGISQLAQSFLSGPSPLERDYLRARTAAAEALGKSRMAEIQREAQRQQAMQALPGLITPSQPVSRPSAAFQGPMPIETPTQAYTRNEPEIWRNAMAAAPATDPGKAGDIARLFAGFAGVEPDRMAQIRMGAGDAYSNTQRGFEAGEATDLARAFGVQDLRNAGDMAELEYRLANEKVPVSAGASLYDPVTNASAFEARPTKSVAEAGILSRMSPADQEAAVRKSVTPRGYKTPDGQTGTSIDGVTDAMSGEPLPPGTVPWTTNTSEIPTAIATDQYKSEKAIDRFRVLTQFTRELAEKDPSNFGFPGFIKGTVQDVRALLDGVSRSMGYANPDSAFREIQARIVNNPDIDPSLLSGIFDPNLASLQSAADLLAFSAAEALANQQGRSVSDRDIEIFKNIAGDPSDFFTSQEKFLAKLQTMENIIDAFGRADEGGAAAPAQDSVEERDPLGILSK